MKKIDWFEIPTSNFQRAVTFYQTIFQIDLRVQQFGPFQMGVFPHAENDGAGCVIAGDSYIPGADGVVIYLDASPSIDAVLNRIEAAGGKIKAGKMPLPEHMGYIAYFFDTEGNRLALHSME